MNVFLWIIAGVLAVAFLVSGAMKLIKSKEDMKAQGMDWVDDVSANTLKLVGALEVLAAIGLVVPPLVEIAPVLAPLAAVGLVLIMVGAIVVHARRKETQMIVVNLVLLALAAVLAWGRFGPEQFTA